MVRSLVEKLLSVAKAVVAGLAGGGVVGVAGGSLTEIAVSAVVLALATWAVPNKTA